MRAAAGAARVVGVDFAGAMLGVGLEKTRASRARTCRHRSCGRRERGFRWPTARWTRSRSRSASATWRTSPRRATRSAACSVPAAASPSSSSRFHTSGRARGLPLVLQSVLPRIGRLMSRHDAAYGYLPASVGAFAPPEEFVRILRNSGFNRYRPIPLTFGIVYLIAARKPIVPAPARRPCSSSATDILPVSY